MYIKVKLVALLILISGIAHAANKQDAYIKAINYCNCRIANTYCKQYSEMNPNSPEKKSYDIITHIFKCSFDQSLAIDSINRILKENNFSEFSKKSSAVFGRIEKEDIETLNAEDVISKIISGIYESAEFKDFLAKYSEVGSLRVPLTKELTEYLSKSFPPNVVAVKDGAIEDVGTPETELQKEVSRLERLIEENKTSSFSLNWLSIILIVVFSGLVFIILKIKLEKLEKRTDRHRNELDLIDTKKLGNNFPQPKIQNSNFNDFKNSVERNIIDLNSAITSLQKDVRKLDMKLQGNSETSPSAPQVEKPQRIETLYAPIPNKDGSFTATNVTSIENQSSSFYKFTIIDNLSQKATFEFLNVERAIKDATSSPELILNPVCKIKNALNQNAKRIKTLKQGTVVKKDDKWIVDQQAEIEYE
jgi:hypothetical protein